MAHSHHHHGPSKYNRIFALGVGLNVLYILIELGFGLYVNSLALLADAGHNLSDVFGLLLAWGAHALSYIKPTDRRTYGWRSSSILAALFNGLILLIAVGGILWEAIRRFNVAPEMAGTTVMWVAGCGVIINAITALLFFADRDRDLNIRGAFLHMAADAAISLGVVLAGWGMWATGHPWIDPITSIVVALIIFFGTWGLLRDSVNLALQAVPEGIDVMDVRAYLKQLDGVTEVHDLHIWPMSTTETALTVHLVKPDPRNNDQLLATARQELHDRFSIEHITVQIEQDAAAADCCQQDEANV